MALDQAIGIASSLAVLLTAVAAIFTAVGTFRTVRQMQRQMEASYRPELTFSGVAVKGEAGSPQCPLPTHWTIPLFAATEVSSAVSAAVTFLPQSQWTQPNINLYNVGLGAATSVTILWDLPIAKMVTQINALAQQTLTPVYYKYEKDLLSLESEIWGKKTLIWSSSIRTTSIDYILPESQRGGHYLYYVGGMPIMIPPVFTDLVSAYLYFSIMKKESDTQFESPVLSAVISYNDISGFRYQDVFKVKCDITLVTHPQQDRPMTFEGSLQSEKVGVIKAPRFFQRFRVFHRDANFP
jgi:UPF0716 family protein affecting phage T7 exclusion